tara:strand:+ start:221 stop:490 length:270 start_codon:yes stop_codon:yes gene_type:complete
MKDKLEIGEGQPVKTSKDIVKFLKYMSKKYNIKQERGIIDMVVNNYLKSPKGKDHIVMNNRGDEWFLNFLSNEDVLGKMEIPEKVKFYS